MSTEDQRLKRLAKAYGISANQLMEGLSTVARGQRDAEMRFRLRSDQGSAERGSKLIDKIESSLREAGESMVWRGHFKLASKFLDPT